MNFLLLGKVSGKVVEITFSLFQIKLFLKL